MYLLVLDTETTGLPSETFTPQLIEVAAALYCTESKSILASLQFIVPNQTLKNEAEHINGITEKALGSANQLDIKGDMEKLLDKMIDTCDYIVAHNAKFDKKTLDLLSNDVNPEYLSRSQLKEWICTYADIQFPKTKRSLVLSHIAVDHGVMPSNAHRAMGDVETLVQLLEKVPDLDAQIDRVINLRHNGKYFIVVEDKESPRVDNSIYKKAGFKWNFDLKSWGKWMLPEESEVLSFFTQSVDYK